jgi:hypothetical protein
MKSLLIVSIVLLGMSAPAFGGSITITLNPSNEGYPLGSAAFLCELNGSPGEPCVMFSGTITDTDTDGSYLFLNSVALDPTVPADSYFTVDNTFYNDVPGVFSGDPNWATDDEGNPSNSYTGLLFGLDFAADTPAGIYDGMLIFSAVGGDIDPDGKGFTVEVPFEVDIDTPEPASGLMLLAGLLATGAWRRARR